MTTDLIKRLEAAYKTSMPVGDLWNLCTEAADELERLAAEEEGLTTTVIRQGEILRHVVVAVRGLPPEGKGWSSHDAAELVRAVVAERDNIRSRLDRAIRAAEEHFGEEAIRYKLSLFANGRARNVFPQRVDGHWFALQRADNDAHMGLSLRCLEAEAERDNLRHELDQLKRDHDSQGGMLELTRQRRDELEPQRAELVAAWNDLPDSVRCHPGLKRLFRACQVA